MGGGLDGGIGMVAGILAASKRGEGCYIDIALADAVSTFNLGKLQSVLTTGKSYVTSHMDRAFLKCKDGKFIAQANVEPHNWARFCEATLLPRPRRLPQADPQTRERMIEELCAMM